MDVGDRILVEEILDIGGDVEVTDNDAPVEIHVRPGVGEIIGGGRHARPAGHERELVREGARRATRSSPPSRSRAG